jgi:hypothetical protein
MRDEAFFPKRRTVCKKCKKAIERGTKAVRTTYFYRVIPGKISLIKRSYCYDCWKENVRVRLEKTLRDMETWFNDHLAFSEQRRGKYPIATRNVIRNKLSCLRYHRRVGHTERVLVLEREIEQLKTICVQPNTSGVQPDTTEVLCDESQ